MPETKLGQANLRTNIIASVKTPLGFFVLAILIAETMLGVLVSKVRITMKS